MTFSDWLVETDQFFQKMDVLKPSVKWISQNDSQAEKEVVAVGFFVNIVQLKDLYDAFRKH